MVIDYKNLFNFLASIYTYHDEKRRRHFNKLSEWVLVEFPDGAIRAER